MLPGTGMAIDSIEPDTSATASVFVDGSTFTGGISNAGEIRVLGHGIQIGTSTTPVVSYGPNSGLIDGEGIVVANVIRRRHTIAAR